MADIVRGPIEDLEAILKERQVFEIHPPSYKTPEYTLRYYNSDQVLIFGDEMVKVAAPFLRERKALLTTVVTLDLRTCTGNYIRQNRYRHGELDEMKITQEMMNGKFTKHDDFPHYLPVALAALKEKLKVNYFGPKGYLELADFVRRIDRVFTKPYRLFWERYDFSDAKRILKNAKENGFELLDFCILENQPDQLVIGIKPLITNKVRLLLFNPAEMDAYFLSNYLSSVEIPPKSLVLEMDVPNEEPVLGCFTTKIQWQSVFIGSRLHDLNCLYPFFLKPDAGTLSTFEKIMPLPLDLLARMICKENEWEMASPEERAQTVQRYKEELESLQIAIRSGSVNIDGKEHIFTKDEEAETLKNLRKRESFAYRDVVYTPFPNKKKQREGGSEKEGKRKSLLEFD